MTIVPVYRLRATPTDPHPRYRFSRDAHPNPNPMPGRPDPDPESVWSIDRVAFYAWSDPAHADRINRRLVPIYEFYRVDANGRVSYRYSAGGDTLDGWVAREHVAFWMQPAGTGRAGAPVYLYSRRTSEGLSYVLSINPGFSDPWENESVLAVAAATLPVVVSVRPDEDHRRFHWSYAPSTINLSYATTIAFVQAPLSAWRFLDLEVPGGREDFDPPIVTDGHILLNARYANPGQDFRFRLTIEPFAGPNRVTSDANVPHLNASEDRSSVTDRAVNDPEMVNQTPDRL